MNALPPNASAEQVEEEIIFTRMLLDTLDRRSATYPQDRRDRELQLEQLQAHYSMLTFQDNMPGPSHANGAASSASFQQNDLSQHRFGEPSAFLPSSSRKRPRTVEHDLLAADYANKSSRTTPSPAATTPGTSSSSDSFEMWERGLPPAPQARPPPNAAPNTGVRQAHSSLNQSIGQRQAAQARAAQARGDPESARAWEASNQARRQLQQPRPQLPAPPGLNRTPSSHMAPPSHRSVPSQPIKSERSWHSPSRSTPNQTPFNQRLPLRSVPGPPNSQYGAAPQPSASNSIEIIDLCGSDSDSDIQEIASHSHSPAVRPGVQRAASGSQTPWSNGYAHSVPHRPVPAPVPQRPWMASAGNAMTAAGRSIFNTLHKGMSSFNGFNDGLDIVNNPLTPGEMAQHGGYSQGMFGDGSQTQNVISLFGRNGYQTAPSSAGSHFGYPPGSYPTFPDIDDRYDPFDRDDYSDRYNRYGSYHDPAAVEEELKKMLGNIRPDDEIPPDLRLSTPEAMGSGLMEHQKLGLSWLRNMEEGTNKGSILADEMGLGKTIQALALIVSRPSEDPRMKTTLVVAPVALMRQWEREIKTKIKTGRHALKVGVYHGSSKKRSFKDLSQFDIVLTSFGTLASEFSRKERIRDFVAPSSDTPDAMPTPKRDEAVLLARDALWYRVILDEAHNIKNKDTKTSKACCELQSVYRLCMTGTPMMNRVEELFSLIKFLRIPPYCEWSSFRRDIKQPLEKGGKSYKEDGMRKLQALLKAVLLRRTQDSKIDGKPIFELPPKTIVRDHVAFDEAQQEFYNALETKSQLRFNKYLKEGSVGKQYSHVLVLLLRLRQACCHPHLLKDFAEPLATDVPEESMEAFAAQLTEEVVSRIKAENGAFSCPICFDAVDNPAIFLPCGHNTCSECFVRITDPTRADDGFKCPACRGKLDPKRITDYKSFKKIHMRGEPDPDDDLGIVFPEGDSDSEEDSEEDEDEEEEDDDDDDDTLDGFIVPDVADDAMETNGDTNLNPAAKANGSAEAEATAENKKPQRKRKKKKNKDKGKGPAKKKLTLGQLRKDAHRNKAAKRRYFKRLTKNWETSAKIDKTMELLRGIRNEDPTEKTLIFSQFTSLIDLLEVPLSRENMESVRFDGSMSPDIRNEAVNRFIDSPTCNVMVVSLKAGNAGLNLNAASQVILLDPFWNPYVEYQAIGRAHRLGQQRRVIVHRILVPKTVEDRIMDLQRKKEELISTALDENAGKSIARLGVQELAYLFGVRATLPQRNGQ